MANGYRAETPLRVGDHELTLQIDYQAVGSFMTLLGGREWTSGVLKAFDDYDLHLVSKIIQIAAKRHHPDITAEWIFESSPPFNIAFKALEAAMFCFLYGHPSALDNLDLSEKEEEEKEASGKAPLLSVRARWRERGKSLMRQAFRAASSGG